MMTEIKNTKEFYNTEIPSDWEVKKFEKIAKFFSGGTPLTTKPEYYSGDIPFIKSGEIYYDKTEQFISDEGLNNSSAKMVEKGDLLYALYGANSGEIAISKINGAINQALLCIRHNGDCDTVFIYNYLLHQKENIIRTYLQGGQGNLSAEIVKTLQIPLPPLPEQKAIAQVLSTADAAIHTTEKLIAQKELRKKWLMQQLLKGKKRLLNDELRTINDEWKPIRIGDVFKFIKSYSISREGLQNYNEGSVFCIHYGDIHAKYDSSFLDFERQKNIPQLIDENISIEEGNYLQDGDIVMADASEDYEGVGAAVEVKNLSNKKAIGGLHTLVLRADKKTISTDFAAYFFASEKVRNTLRKYATGTSVYSVTKTQIHNLSFIIPNSLKEQTAIAQVLQAADKEISLLKAKAEKLREQKKGLMQQLLTGKVRLKID